MEKSGTPIWVNYGFPRAEVKSPSKWLRDRRIAKQDLVYVKRFIEAAKSLPILLNNEEKLPFNFFISYVVYLEYVLRRGPVRSIRGHSFSERHLRELISKERKTDNIRVLRDAFKVIKNEIVPALNMVGEGRLGHGPNGVYSRWIGEGHLYARTLWDLRRLMKRYGAVTHKYAKIKKHPGREEMEFGRQRVRNTLQSLLHGRLGEAKENGKTNEPRKARARFFDKETGIILSSMFQTKITTPHVIRMRHRWDSDKSNKVREPEVTTYPP